MAPDLAPHAGHTPVGDASRAVPVLDAPRRCAFVLRPGWRTTLTQPESLQWHEVRR
jgi:hypothetical protein